MSYLTINKLFKFLDNYDISNLIQKNEVITHQKSLFSEL